MSNTLKQLERAKEIVDRYLARGRTFPRELRDCGRTDPERQQEYRDACKIKTWKYSLMGKNRYTCSDEVRDYLDENMPGWRDRVYSHKGRSSSAQMTKARDIVRRYQERGCIRPRRLNDPSRLQEYKDAVNLSTWKSALKGHNRVTCSSELRDYLDVNIPGWRDDHNSHRSSSLRQSTTSSSSTSVSDLKDEKSTSSTEINTKVPGTPRIRPTTEELMPIAAGIVQRYEERGRVLPSLKAECRADPSRAQECKDAGKLHSWKIHTSEKLTPEVLSFLDTHMPGWKKASGRSCGNSRRSTQQKHSPLHLTLLKAREIVQRCMHRLEKGEHALPRHLNGRQTIPYLILEQKDALKLSEWKRSALISSGSGEAEGTIHWELKAYLDKALCEWMSIDVESPESFPPSQTTGSRESFDLPDSSVPKSKAQKSVVQNTTAAVTLKDVRGASEKQTTHPQCPLVWPEADKMNSSKSNSYRDDMQAEELGVAALLQLSTGRSNTGKKRKKPMQSTASTDGTNTSNSCHAHVHNHDNNSTGDAKSLSSEANSKRSRLCRESEN